MQLSVIIVNYNVKYFLEHCLLSVLAAGKNLNVEIFVIDNHSQDGSEQYFRDRFPEVRFFWKRENAGFGRANNFALQMATGRYILFLNPDTILPEDCFTKCLLFLEEKNDEAALGVRMVNGEGKFLKESKRAFPSPMTSLLKLSGLSALFPRSRLFARYHLGHLNEFETGEVDVLAGAFMLIPAKILDVTGGFDEDFFMYGEDIDLSYRMQRAGFTNYYFSETTILHFKGESTKKSSISYVRTFYEAMSIFARKHYGGRAVAFNWLIQCGIILRGTGSAIATSMKLLKSLLVREKKAPGENTIGVVGSRADLEALRKKFAGNIRLLLLAKEDIEGVKYDEIVFCEESLSFKEIISLVQKLPENLQPKFYCARLNSIISTGK